ncbi:ATP-binding cassette domain-containing protein [Lachnoclostridium phytofermentans]|uniref:ATP-binding cassette domain-containing protein n=1 Tax=Lachnoclostridium phytofermentans TaxID=66219 RepID=UPI000495A439|nr:ATP-binding cassette domain-containing protein [Lachnoclostridium phytofermentans]
MKTIALQVVGLTKQYKKYKIVNRVSLTGYSGEILGILGQKGDGKTTIIKIVTGLLKKEEGTIIIGGYDIDYNYEDAIKEIAVLVRLPRLLKHLSGIDTLSRFAKASQKGKEQLERVKVLVSSQLDLNNKVKSYSAEMKLILSIGLSLLSKPMILVLDEPVRDFNPIATKKIRDFLKKVSHEQGICILVSSTMLWEMEKLCDRVMILSKGNNLGTVGIKELLDKDKNLEDFYLEQSCYYEGKRSIAERGCTI